MITRLLRRVRAQAPFLLALAVLAAAAGYLLLWPDHWRRGVAGISASMLLAGVLRLILPDHRAGLLDVRGRWIDAFLYLALGVVIVVATVKLG